MEDPVSTMDGQTYERAAITEWLENNDTSPSTGEILSDKSLIPNYGKNYPFVFLSFFLSSIHLYNLLSKKG
jgi:hypothetical protein